MQTRILREYTGGVFISLTGIILKGRYCIVNQLGKGGEGTLYLARDLELGIYRAVKELPVSQKREAKLLRLLDHPFLPGMIDYAEREEKCYLIMEYIPGKSLGELLEEGRNFAPEEIARIGIRVLQIFSYLHSRKPAVYYGDLKPENLMLTEEGELYLVDFGSAVFGYARQQYNCLGTRGYAAPEQYHGKISAASDIYALGKTLEALCGKKKIKCFFFSPRLGLFIRKCCHGRETKRWNTAEEAEAALSAVRPFSLRRRDILLPAAVFFLLLFLVSGSGGEDRENLPSFEAALSPVTAWYYSMPYRSGGSELRAEISSLIERALQRLAKRYKDNEAQILLLLAGNSELQGSGAKAEMYYSELQKEGDAIPAYGLFLIRQERDEESRELYERWKQENCFKDSPSFVKDMWKKALDDAEGEAKK